MDSRTIIPGAFLFALMSLVWLVGLDKGLALFGYDGPMRFLLIAIASSVVLLILFVDIVGRDI